MEDHNEHQPPVNPALGISRRTVLRRGAVVGGSLVWAAPAVQSITRTALADHNGTPHPQCPCDAAAARGVFVNAAGNLVDATVLVGSAPPNEQIGNAQVFVPPGATNPAVKAELITVTADGTDGVCEAFAEILNADVDLRNINALLDVQLTASILQARSVACPESVCTSHVADVVLTVAGLNVPVTIAPPPNTTVVDFTDPTGTLSVQLVLNEQQAVNGGCRVRALRLEVQLTTALVNQHVTVIISEAEAH